MVTDFSIRKMISVLVYWVEFTQILKTVCTSISDDEFYYHLDAMLECLDK